MNRFLANLCVLFGALVLPSSLAAAPLTEEERARVEAVFADLVEADEPGYAVGIVRGGETVFETYGGLAEMSHAVPIGPQTRINVASLAKQYVALMVLDLAEAGKINLAADFRFFLRDALPKIEPVITVAQLLTHTSGVRDHTTLRALMGVTWYERPLNNRSAMALLNQQEELNFAPGSAFLYSNANYILLAEVVAAVTGERFDLYARSFFDRIGMPHSGWKRRYGLALPNEAKGYMNFNGWIANPQIANYFGDGFLYTTLPDQLAWERQLQGAGSALSPSLLERSQTRPHSELPGDYGFGLEFASFLGAPAIFHSGSTGGYNAYTLRLPESDSAIVVMLNTSQISARGLGQRVAAALLDAPLEAIGDYPAAPSLVLDRPRNASVLGRYELDSGTIMRIVERNGELVREIDGTEPVKLLHDRGNVFEYATIPGLKIAFDNDTDGTKRVRLFLPTQAPQSGQELAPVPTAEDARSALAGCYFNRETRTEIVIDWDTEQGFRMIKNGRSREALMVAPDYLRWNTYRLRFERNGGGRVARLWVDNGRIRNVRFEKWDQCRGESLGRFTPL